MCLHKCATLRAIPISLNIHVCSSINKQLGNHAKILIRTIWPFFRVFGCSNKCSFAALALPVHVRVAC